MTIPGLPDRDSDEVIGLIAKYPEIQRALLFGSRAKGTFRPGSDVDLVFEGSGLSFETIRRVSYELNEETNLPYRFDVLDRSLISSPELLEHIERVGLCVYEKGMIHG